MLRRTILPIVYSLLSAAIIVAMAWSLDHFRRYQPYAGLLSPDALSPRSYALMLTDVELRGRSGGQPQWSFHAADMRLGADQTNLAIESVQRGVFMLNARPCLRFSADHAVCTLGSLDSTPGFVSVTGGIHIDSAGNGAPISAPFSAATQSATWSAFQSLLTLPERVDVRFGRTPTSPAIAVLAQGARWNAVTHQLSCPASVQADIETSAGPGHYELASSGLVYNQPAGQIECINPVTLQVPSLGTASCRPLVLDTAHHTADFGAVHVVVDSPRKLIDAASAAAGPPDAPPAPSPAGIPAADAKPDASPASKAEDNQVTVDAPQGGRWDEQAKTLTIRGPVTFHQGDASMSTVGAIYDRKTDTAKALSAITITDPDTVVNGKAGTVDFKQHIATIAGSIVIHIYPKDEQATAGSGASSSDSSTPDTEAHQPSVMTCDAVVYNYRQKLAKTDGTVVIKQTHRTVTADKGTYDAAAHIAELTGHVVADSDDGKHMEADYAKVSLKKGDEWIDVPNPTKITFKVNDEDKP